MGVFSDRPLWYMQLMVVKCYKLSVCHVADLLLNIGLITNETTVSSSEIPISNLPPEGLRRMIRESHVIFSNSSPSDQTKYISKLSERDNSKSRKGNEDGCIITYGKSSSTFSRTSHPLHSIYLGQPIQTAPRTQEFIDYFNNSDFKSRGVRHEVLLCVLLTSSSMSFYRLFQRCARFYCKRHTFETYSHFPTLFQKGAISSRFRRHPTYTYIVIFSMR